MKNSFFLKIFTSLSLIIACTGLYAVGSELEAETIRGGLFTVSIALLSLSMLFLMIPKSTEETNDRRSAGHSPLKSVVVLVAITLASCTDADRAKIGGLGDSFKIELINCDGSVARHWISTGKVHSEASSDGYYFKDQTTGKLIEVTGILVITKQ